MSDKIYQAQCRHSENDEWHPMATRGGQKYCNSLGGAKSKGSARGYKRDLFRVVEYKLDSGTVVYTKE